MAALVEEGAAVASIARLRYIARFGRSSGTTPALRKASGPTPCSRRYCCIRHSLVRAESLQHSALHIRHNIGRLRANANRTKKKKKKEKGKKEEAEQNKRYYPTPQ